MTFRNDAPIIDWRIAKLIGLVVVSLVIPVAIAGWTIRTAMSGKPFAWHCNEYRNYSTCLKNNEMWYVAAYPLGPNPAKMIQTCHLMRMNLETGGEVETEITFEDDEIFGKQMIWIGDELYFYNSSDVHRLNGKQIERLGQARSPSTPFLGPPFLFEGRLTIVTGTQTGEYRLCLWDDQQWIDGRRIVLPKTNQIWYHDAERDRKSLLPSTLEQPNLLKSAAFPRLDIRYSGSVPTLLFQSADSNLAAFRRGFDFVDDGRVSALAPANWSAEATGWRPLPAYPDDRNATRKEAYALIFSNREGIHFAVVEDWRNREKRPRIFRLDDSGEFHELKTLYQTDSRSYLRLQNFAAVPSEANSYLIRWSERETNKAEISRIEGDTILEPHILIAGAEPSYLARWRKIGVGLLIAWLAHSAILIGGTCWITRGRTQRVALGHDPGLPITPVWRRVFAFVVDACLAMEGLLIVFVVAARDLFRTIVLPNGSELLESLIHIELLLWWYLNEGASPLEGVTLVTRPMRPFVNSLPFSREIFFILCAALIAMYAVRLYLESRHGITPGKWLVGIRTTTTARRPIGFARAIVKDALLWFDVPLLLTPLPAVVSMILSDHCQRLGDRVADSVVATASGIRDSNDLSARH